MPPSDKIDNLENYFDEFDSLYSFDNEVCPTCGARNFDSCEFPPDNFVLLKSCKTLEKAKEISVTLEKADVTNQIIFENLSPPLWNILVMYRDQIKAKVILKNFE